MGRITFLIFVILISVQEINYSQETINSSTEFTLAFYNVENLFDTIDDPNIRDAEFTPQGKKKWTSKRYTKKIDDIAKVLSSINPAGLPELIGLAEVENQNVLKDLINSPALKEGNYSTIHYNSPDERGIDVALLFQESEFQILKSNSIPVTFPFDEETKVRDLLYVKGIIKTDTIHVFVNHWKSRSGGEEETEPKRVYTASVLEEKTDSIFNKNTEAKIAIIGDFNDEPVNKSLRDILEAGNPKENSMKYDLYNLMWIKDKNGKGTYNYKYEWYMLDNFIVSSSFVNAEDGYKITPERIHIHNPEWLLFDHPKAGMKIPDRTYGGPNYYGGISDHLAIYGIFELTE